jgi:hypothetical protein
MVAYLSWQYCAERLISQGASTPTSFRFLTLSRKPVETVAAIGTKPGLHPACQLPLSIIVESGQRKCSPQPAEPLLRQNGVRSICLPHHRHLAGGKECAKHEASEHPGDAGNIELGVKRPPLGHDFVRPSVRVWSSKRVVVNAIDDFLKH